MTSQHEIVIGIDVGTTSLKALAYTLDGEVVGRARQETPWDVARNGQTEVDIDLLADIAMQVMADAVPQEHASGSVVGVGITGMAETGALIDARLRPVMPAMAWFDERGKAELAAHPALAAEFQATTGLGYKAESSFSKLLWRHAQGQAVPMGGRWLNALEYVAFRLTGMIATEQSLASRTGLMDQRTLTPWATTLDLVGGSASMIPDLLPAGSPLGHVLESAPRALRGAAVTVAGHDHLVGSLGAGAIGSDDLYNSCGTADVILRAVSRDLTNDERASLVSDGLSAGRHVIPGATAVLGATRAGLVLGRIMSMLGIESREDRRAMADSWIPDPSRASHIVVSEPPGWANELTIAMRSDVTPSETWSAALDYTLGVTRRLLDAIENQVGPHREAVAAGGWAHLDGVFRAKGSIIPGLRRFEGEEPGTRGAAMLASVAANHREVPLAADVAARFHPSRKELVS